MLQRLYFISPVIYRNYQFSHKLTFELYNHGHICLIILKVSKPNLSKAFKTCFRFLNFRTCSGKLVMQICSNNILTMT